MQGFPVLLACLAAIASQLCLPATAKSALSGPAPSYVRPTGDGAHILVMLSEASPDEDAGRVCTLPDGTHVDVRETFASSGLFKIGSTVPVYALDWYEEDYLVLSSPEGRNLVRVNRLGGGDFFADPLPPADRYALGRILHDWTEAKIAEKLLLPDKSGPLRAQMQDLNMLACTEGRERTAAEYETLLRAAGFSRVEACTTDSPLDAVLAVK